MSEKIPVAVIGGGLAGTAAAHTLNEHGYDVTIIEQDDRLGGRIKSELVDDVAVEMGAGFVMEDYVDLLAFAATVDVGDEWQRQRGKIGVVQDGTAHMLTPRTLLGSTPLPWSARTPLVPLILKTLANWRQLDVRSLWKTAEKDVRSVAEVFQSPRGRIFLERVVEPVLDGYFYWTPEQTSEAILPLLCKAATARTYKLRSGLQRIPEAAAIGSALLLGHTVKRVNASTPGLYDVFSVDTNGKETVTQVDGVVCATTASVVPDIFPRLTGQQQAFFGAVHYSSTAVVAQTYMHGTWPGDMSIAFPREERTDLASVTLATRRDKNGVTYATTKMYASGRAAHLISEPDQSLVQYLADNAAPARHIMVPDNAELIATHVQRWPEALPHFDVEHLQRLGAFARAEVEDGNEAIAFAGDYLGGPCMEGAYASGVQAADRLHARLRGRTYSW